MATTDRAEERRALHGTALLVVAGIVVVALNLRAAITVVGPLVPTMRTDLGVDNVAIGAIGTLPVLTFGLVAPLAPVLGLASAGRWPTHGPARARDGRPFAGGPPLARRGHGRACRRGSCTAHRWRGR